MSCFQILHEKKRCGQLTGHALLADQSASKRLLAISVLAPLFEGSAHASAGQLAVTGTGLLAVSVREQQCPLSPCHQL